MSVLWPGALRWTFVATSASARCSTSTASKLDNLFYHTLRNSSSSSCSIAKGFAIRSTRATGLLGLHKPFIRPIRTIPRKRPNLNYAKDNGEPFSLITEYKDLPEDYEDAKGLDFRSHPLTRAEIMQWFGPGVDTLHANNLLRILHGRRVAGTLDDPSLQQIDDIQQKIIQDALAWLRKNVPVDEIQNAGLRAEEELANMDQEVLESHEQADTYEPNADEPADPDLRNRSKRLGIYQSDSTDPEIYAPNAQPAKYYPESALDNIRRINEERAAAREAEEEEARKKLEAEMEQGGDLALADLRPQVELRQRGNHPWLLHYRKLADSVVPDEPPAMSAWQRLYPSGLFAFFTVAGSVLFAATYVPPEYRLMPEAPPAAATILTIIAINAAVLLAWRIPPLWVFLNKYMMVVPGYPRAAAILGNTFSHQDMFPHFLSNMALVWFFGTRLHDQIGRGDFLAIYLSSGVLGAFFSMCSYVLRGVLTSSHLGASGAACGLMGAYCWINRDQELPIAFMGEDAKFPQYSTVVFLALMVLFELRTLHRAKRGLLTINTDSYCHLAGWGTGIVGGEIARRRMKARMEAQQQEKKMEGVLMMKKSVNEDALA